MCLEMCRPHDYRLLNSLRGRGHMLIRGWKVLRLNDIGEIKSDLQCSFLWKSGWNRAKDSIGRSLPIRQLDRVNVNYLGWHTRSFNPGIHIHLKKPSSYGWWIGGHKTIRTVWFYADEVKGATASCRGEVVVNRALMRRAY